MLNPFGLGWLLGFLAFGLAFMWATTVPGEFGGALQGASAALALLCLNDFRLPPFRYAAVALYSAFVHDPCLKSFRRSGPPK